MYQYLSVFLLAALLVPATTGAGAKLTTSWRDPNVTKLNFSKVVVAFVSNDADLRRRVEGGLARRIPRSVAANTLVTNGTTVIWHRPDKGAANGSSATVLSAAVPDKVATLRSRRV